MKNSIVNFIIAAVFFSPTVSEAFFDGFFERVSTGVFIAPYLGQVLNGSFASAPSDPPNASEPNEMKYDMSGQRFGLQFGAMIDSLVLGVDLSQGHFNYKFSDPSGKSVDNSIIKISNANAFIMYRRFKIVPWLGFTFKGHAQDSRQNSTFEGISGLSIGIGFKLYSWLQFNIEGRTYSFSKYTKDGTERSLPDDGRKRFEGSEFLMGLSIPFESNNKRKSSGKR